MCSRAGDRTPAPCGRGADDGSGEGDEDCEAGRPDTTEQPGAGELDRLGLAIDEVADAARGREASTRELAGRLARVWDMVAELDPELARRIADYRR